MSVIEERAKRPFVLKKNIHVLVFIIFVFLPSTNQLRIKRSYNMFSYVVIYRNECSQVISCIIVFID